MKGAPWENRLVYIRMSFAFVYPIDGHRIVESIPLFDHRAAFLECYVVLLFLNFMSYRLSKYSILESTAKIRYSKYSSFAIYSSIEHHVHSNSHHVHSNRAASLPHLLVLYDIFYLPKFREQRYSNRPKMVNSA